MSARVPLATITLSSTANSIDFNNIPQDYRDLLLITHRPTDNKAAGLVRLNNDSTGYFEVRAFGVDSTLVSSTDTPTGIVNLLTSTIFTTLSILDYSATDKHKTSTLKEANHSFRRSMAIATRFAKTDAVTRLVIVATTDTYPIGTVLSLYGIEG